jgi:DNA polymerase III epsilon subunit-like protein
MTLANLVKAFDVDMSDMGKANYHGAMYDTIATARLLHKQTALLRRGFEELVS